MKIVFSTFFLFVLLQLNAQQINPLKTAIIEKSKNSDKAKKFFSGETKSGTDSVPRVFFAGVAGTDALNLKSITASAGLTIGFQFSNRWKGLVSYNFGGNILKSQKADSVPLSTLYFPEAGSSAFSGKLDWTMNKYAGIIGNRAYCNFVAGGDISIGQKNIIKDSVTYGFNILNYDLALRGIWFYHSIDKRNNLEFSLSVLWEHIEVLPNSSQNFNTVFDDFSTKKKIIPPRVYNGLGFNVETHINDLVLYFRSYVPFDTFQGKSDAVGELAYTVGVKAALNWKSF